MRRPFLVFYDEMKAGTKEKRPSIDLFCQAVVPGFEPGQTEPKPVVLPLHHTTKPHTGHSPDYGCKDSAKILILL